MRRLFLLMLGLVFIASQGEAGTGAAFLKIPVGARAVGMGNAYSAVANDVTALFWNPAGLIGLNRKELGLTHAELFAETRYDFAGFAMPIRRNRLAFGVGAVYLSQTPIESRDENRNKAGSFVAADSAISIASSLRISKRSSVGLGLKALRQEIGSDRADGVALDLGYLAATPKLNLALSASNIGSAMQFRSEKYSLPFTLSAGVGYRLVSGLMLAFDARHEPNENRTSLSFGGELSLMSALSIRAGYLSSLKVLQKTASSDSSVDQLSGIGGGIGLKVRSARIDYALTPMGELGLTQRLSLTFGF